MILVLAESGLKVSRGRLLERDKTRIKNPKIGRPDILHHTVLNVFQTPAMVEGLLDAIIHTYDGRAFLARRDRRPPKRYERFCGLMRDLLLYSRVPREDPILREISLEEKLRGYYLVGLTRRGSLESPIKLLERLPKKSALFIGMFPRGYFDESLDRLFNERISISRYPLHARTVAARIVYALEYLYDLSPRALPGDEPHGTLEVFP